MGHSKVNRHKVVVFKIPSETIITLMNFVRSNPASPTYLSPLPYGFPRDITECLLFCDSTFDLDTIIFDGGHTFMQPHSEFDCYEQGVTYDILNGSLVGFSRIHIEDNRIYLSDINFVPYGTPLSKVWLDDSRIASSESNFTSIHPDLSYLVGTFKPNAYLTLYFPRRD